MSIGYTDKPISGLGEDLFEIKKYIDGLTEYIYIIGLQYKCNRKIKNG